MASNFKKEIVTVKELCLLQILEINKSVGAGNKFTASVFEKNMCSWAYRGKCYIYTKSIEPFNEGDFLLSNSKLEIIKSLHNPGAFDFKKYCTLNGVFYTTFIRGQGEYYKVGKSISAMNEKIIYIRSYILQKLRTYIHDPTIIGIAEAMFIGYKNDLDPSLNQTYSNAGVSHVITISGMHLGLIYIMLNLILTFFIKKKQMSIISMVITLPALWLFAFTTGASASVMRSVIMYSFIILSKPLSRQNNSMNALLGAALLMIVHDPNVIYDLGFQLSFGAVLSILIFFAPIRNWVFAKNKLLAYGWSMIALTISAIIITTPLIIFHFQKFSTYSILNNLLIVPLSSMALILEIMLCLNPFDFLSKQIFAPGICFCIKSMNTYSSAMNNVPFSIIETPIIESFQLICIFLMILFLHLFLATKSKACIPILLACGCLLSIFHAANLFKREVDQIVILNLKNAGCILHQHGKYANIYLYGKWQHNKSSLVPAVEKASKFLGFTVQNRFDLGEKTLGLSNKDHSNNILLNGNTFKAMDLKKWMKKDCLFILDGTTQLWKIKQWSKDPQNLHLRFLHTGERGSFFTDCSEFHPSAVKK